MHGINVLNDRDEVLIDSEYEVLKVIDHLDTIPDGVIAMRSAAGDTIRLGVGTNEATYEGNFGLHVYGETGKLIFNSNNKVIRPVGFFNFNLSSTGGNPPNQQTIQLPAVPNRYTRYSQVAPQIYVGHAPSGTQNIGIWFFPNITLSSDSLTLIARVSARQGRPIDTNVMARSVIMGTLVVDVPDN